jgi:hypothetical protein
MRLQQSLAHLPDESPLIQITAIGSGLSRGCTCTINVWCRISELMPRTCAAISSVGSYRKFELGRADDGFRRSWVIRGDEAVGSKHARAMDGRNGV